MTTAIGTLGKERTILIVDDHALFRSGLRLLLESRFAARVEEADGGRVALATVETSDVDVALIDVRMPEVDGIETLKAIKTMRPDVPVVMLSTFAEAETVKQALDAGASGFVLKEADPDQLKEAIDTASSGHGVYVHPVAAAALLANRALEHGEHLTDREFEVLQLLGEGATNEEIGAALYLTEKTVKTHLSAIFRKLGVTNRTQAATKALRDGLLSA